MCEREDVDFQAWAGDRANSANFVTCPNPFLDFTDDVLLKIGPGAQCRTQMLPTFCGDIDCCFFKDAPGFFLIVLCNKSAFSGIRIVP